MRRMIARDLMGLAATVLFCLIFSFGAEAACPPYTYTFSNGSTADATQVNANFTTVMNCANTNTVILPGYISGLQLSTAGSSSTFGIAVGTASNTTALSYMALSSAYTKTTSSWTVGTGNGALDTGTIANNTWYHAFLIQRTDTGVVDVLVSLSPTSPTLPASYTLFRRIGSMKTDGSAHWTKFVQNGDEFLDRKSVV